MKNPCNHEFTEEKEVKFVVATSKKHGDTIRVYKVRACKRCYALYSILEPYADVYF